MESVLSRYSASISELKRNPTALIRDADGATIAILNHNRPAAYLVPADVYAEMLEMLEDYELLQIVKERQTEKKDAFEVTLDDL